MKNILVSGGAGYIGSHTVRLLFEKGYRPVVLDSLITGHLLSVPSEVPFFKGDIADTLLVQNIAERMHIDAVIHFAARSLVSESIQRPDLYFEENTAKTNLFISTLLAAGVRRVIFSSTAAIYGIPDQIPISEDTVPTPLNPYGASKSMIEQSFPWFKKAYGLEWISLRYFNAAGALLDGSLGEHHTPETHLIPLVLQTALGQQKAINVYGTDYLTPDGTCIRDYIHVMDLAKAHLLALEAFENGVQDEIFNVGTGFGYSVREVIDTARQITGQEIPTFECPRRLGDPAQLVADAQKIKTVLNWTPEYSSWIKLLQVPGVAQQASIWLSAIKY
jgi:UDP-glucose 4-epimerase